MAEYELNMRSGQYHVIASGISTIAHRQDRGYKIVKSAGHMAKDVA